MSVRTTADERLDSAYTHIKDAVKDLSSVIIDECWGYDDYREDYKNMLHEVMQELILLKKRLNR
jgi:hypothetical protein